jgi:hypothetical protein
MIIAGSQMRLEDIRNIAVVGVGTMGPGIAQACNGGRENGR